MKVNEFPLLSTLFSDTRIPLQYPGGGASPAQKQVQLAVLLAYLQANIGFGNQLVNVSGSAYAYVIPSGIWLLAYAMEGSTDQTFNVGNTAGSNEITFQGTHTADQVDSFPVMIYGGDSGKTIYFSGLSGTNSITFLTIGIEI